MNTYATANSEITFALATLTIRSLGVSFLGFVACDTSDDHRSARRSSRLSLVILCSIGTIKILYAGVLTSQLCATRLTHKRQVANAKHTKADISSGVLPLCPDFERSDIAALTNCTRLTTTPTAAWPAMTACISLGPKIDATANTGG